MENLHERAVRAAAQYVGRKGYEVLDESWSTEALAGRIDLVAEDEGTIVFVEVTASNIAEGGFAEARLAREQLEVLVATWLAGNSEECNVPVRFDAVDIMAAGNDRALLRHTVNKLGTQSESQG